MEHKIDPNVSRNFTVAKFFSILIVVFGHYPKPFDIWVIVTIGLLIFAYSSGFFTYLKYNGDFDKKKFLWNKIERLSLNLMVVNVFLLIIFLIKREPGIWTWHSLINALGLNGWLTWLRIPNQSPFGAAMWFFTLLLIFYAIYPLLEYLNRNKIVSYIFAMVYILTAFHLNYLIPYGHMLWLTSCGFIAGMGGVGAITVELLARWGVKKFRLFDMDVYEASNLNRQLFATSETIGNYKVDAAAERIKKINPYTEVEMFVREMANNNNVEPFVMGAGMVIQNADRPSAKLFYLNAQKHKVPLVNGYATISGGRVQTFDYRVSSCESILDQYWNRFKLGDSKPLTMMSPNEVLQFDKAFVHQTSPSLNFVTNMVGCLIVDCGGDNKLLTEKGKCVQYQHRSYLEFDIFDTLIILFLCL